MGTGKLVIAMIYDLLSSTVDLEKNGLQHRRRKTAASASVTFCKFDWERVSMEALKFANPIPCAKRQDRMFLYKALALSQRSARYHSVVWDAREAVIQIHPRTPIAYFRTVLKDNFRKAGLDLQAALRTVRPPASWV
jgi:hypothetical protein